MERGKPAMILKDHKSESANLEGRRSHWKTSVKLEFQEFVVPNFKTPGASYSKLTTSLVNVSLKFQTLILQIHCYFLLKKCENTLHCKGFSHFFSGHCYFLLKKCENPLHCKGFSHFFNKK